jgi:hypothetical protein
VVLPANQDLQIPFFPNVVNNGLGLTINSIAGNVISFSFPANNSTNILSGGIGILGQVIPVAQNWVIPPILTGAVSLPNGGFQFGFTNNQGAAFTVLASTNLTLPLANWQVVGTATNLGSGLFQFAAPLDTNQPQTFYRVRSP